MKQKSLWIAGLALTLFLGGCAAKQPQTAGQETAAVSEAETTADSTESAMSEAAETVAEGQKVTIAEEQVPLYAKPAYSQVRTPVASGTVTYGNGNALIDASNANLGYVMLRYSGHCGKIKVQISKDGITYTYNLRSDGNYEVFPMSEGNGYYSIKVYENVSGNQYAMIFSQDIAVTLTDAFGPFLTPNQYCNFYEGSAAVQMGAQLAATAVDDRGVVENVYNYVINNTTYDVAKAQTVQSGYLPDVDQILASHTGICFDYAALMVSMLRSQNVPAKLVVGYTGAQYHAWVNVYIEGVGWVDNYIYFDGTNWSLMDPTFASSGGQSDTIKAYIGNGANYQQKYCY